MKRLLSLVLMCCILLPLCAGAETIRDQLNAPDTYQNTFQSNSGRTLVEVNASVYVPEVESIPIYAVTVRDFTAEEGWRLAQLLEPGQEWQRWDRKADIAEDDLCHNRYGVGGQFESTEMNLGLPAPANTYISLINSYLVGVFNRQPSGRELKYRSHDPETQMFFQPAIAVADPDTVGKSISGQPLTVDGATDMANAFMAEMAPDYAMRITAATHGESISNTRAQEHQATAYVFGYTRDVGGVPITYVSHEITEADFVDTPMAPAPGQELISLVIHDKKIVSFLWKDPYQIGEVVQPSAALLPFEQIMRIFGSVAPLAVQRTEIEDRQGSGDENGMKISEIRLGYMPVLKKDDPNQWELRPVWDFMGVRIHPLGNIDWPCYSLLTIDAVDGTIIDRNYGY